MIELRDVEFRYRTGGLMLRVPELTVDHGLTMIVGANGSGKSTLLRLIAGVEKPTKGSIAIHGVDLWRNEAEARACLAYVPERPEVAPYATILDVLRFVAGLRRVDADSIWPALSRVELDAFASMTIRELSLGQRRRVLLAAALIGEPPVVILDEPLDAMDAKGRAMIIDWLDQKRRDDATIIVVSHEIEPFAELIDATFVVDRGSVASAPSAPS